MTTAGCWKIILFFIMNPNFSWCHTVTKHFHQIGFRNYWEARVFKRDIQLYLVYIFSNKYIFSNILLNDSPTEWLWCCSKYGHFFDSTLYLKKNKESSQRWQSIMIPHAIDIKRMKLKKWRNITLNDPVRNNRFQ